MGLGGTQMVVAGSEFGHTVHAKYTKKDTTKQEILMVAMLTGGHTGYK